MEKADSMEIKKQDVQKLYNLPDEVIFCKRCTVSNQRPRITFTQEGICSACHFADYKKNIDWNAREQELIELCNKHRRNDGSYDILVPSSGGKDSGYIAHQLKYKYGMNPLTVTWAPIKYTDIGYQNFQGLIHAGLDNILGTPNTPVLRKLAKLAFIHQADPFQPWIYGLVNFPLRMAVQNKISLLMYGEYSESEYGGEINKRPVRDFNDVELNRLAFSGKPPEFWESYGVSKQDLAPYMSPSYNALIENKTEVHFLGYYKFWDPQENYYYCVEHTNFQANPERTEGTYSKYASLDDKIDGFHYWMGYLKFGIGRATSDTAHEIRDGKINREEGVALVKKFDGEFPKKYFKEFLEFCDITEGFFWEVVNSWRSPHIWEEVDGEWRLKNAVWYEQK